MNVSLAEKYHSNEQTYKCATLQLCLISSSHSLHLAVNRCQDPSHVLEPFVRKLSLDEIRLAAVVIDLPFLHVIDHIQQKESKINKEWKRDNSKHINLENSVSKNKHVGH